MPDAWETVRGLNPNNAADRNATAASGYTNLEVYINGPCEKRRLPGDGPGEGRELACDRDYHDVGMLLPGGTISIPSIRQ
jgi:hypothetical protein